MLKIVFVSEQVVERFNGSYYNTSLFTFLERYRQYGEVHTFCYVKNANQTKSMKLDFPAGNEISFLHKPNNIYRRFISTSGNYKSLKKVISRCDLVICHLPSASGNIAIDIAKKYNKLYVIGCVGCVWDSLFNYNWKGKLIAPLEFFKMRQIIKKAPFVFYVTQYFLQNRYPCKGSTIGCSNVDIHISDEGVIRRKQNFLKESTGRINLMTTAAVDVRYKGQQSVIRAVAQLIKEGLDIHYYLAGGGDNSYLQSIAVKLGIRQNVHFLGSISRQEIFDYLDRIHCYIQPSKQEGLPRALVEAMSRGCPALGSTVAGIPELLSADCLFKASDVETIVNLLKSMTMDKALRCSKENFEKAKLYDKQVLDKRRDDFFKLVIQMIKE